EDAAAEFQAELSRQPRHLQALTYLGDTEIHLDRNQAAIGHLRQALQLDANNRLGHLDLAIVLTAGGASDQAAMHLREAIRLDPAKPDAHYRLGKLLRMLGRDEEAEAEFAKVKELAREEPPDPLIKVPGRPGP